MAKVLLVDDSSLARRSTRKILEDAGHQAVEAQDGLTALERYFTDKPDVVLLDVTMKDMDGIEVLRRLRELDPAARVIIVTADVQDSTREMAEAGGARGFVIKPIAASSLLKCIHTVVELQSSCN
jgi:two-component system chemotaxis response regulator CheY